VHLLGVYEAESIIASRPITFCSGALYQKTEVDCLHSPLMPLNSSPKCIVFILVSPFNMQLHNIVDQISELGFYQVSNFVTFQLTHSTAYVWFHKCNDYANILSIVLWMNHLETNCEILGEHQRSTFFCGVPLTFAWERQRVWVHIICKGQSTLFRDT